MRSSEHVPRWLTVITGLLGCYFGIGLSTANAEQYLSKQQFLQLAFPADTYEHRKLWLNKDLKLQAKQILQHDYPGLRVRYWIDKTKTAWILEEIGKEKPISIGVVVEQGKVHAVRILAFRESRGWEVRHDFFTDQFAQVQLQPNYQLNKAIDGISGATLSVRAVNKVVRLALLFDQYLARQKKSVTDDKA